MTGLRSNNLLSASVLLATTAQLQRSIQDPTSEAVLGRNLLRLPGETKA